MVLELIFGMTQTPVSVYLQFCMLILIRVLQNMDDAKIKRPTVEQIVQYQESVRQRHPRLENVWCTMDGLKLTLEQSATIGFKSSTTMDGHTIIISLL